MLKDFLEKTDVNSFRYSAIGGEVALELALKALARHWEIVDDALMSIGEWVQGCTD